MSKTLISKLQDVQHALYELLTYSPVYKTLYTLAFIVSLITLIYLPVGV